MRFPPRWRRAALPWAVFGLLTAWLVVRIAEWDVWFHLLVGKEIIRTGHIPTAEFYVYPTLGTASGFHEWGFGLLCYLVERAGGLPALGLLNAALGAGALALV